MARLTPILDRAIAHLNQASIALKEARVSFEIVRDRDVSVIIGMAAATDGISTAVDVIRREADTSDSPSLDHWWGKHIATCTECRERHGNTPPVVG